MENLPMLLTPAVMTGIVEIGKHLKFIKPGDEKIWVFFLAIIFAVVWFFNKGLAEMAIGIIGFALTAVGNYEMVVKPLQKTLE